GASSQRHPVGIASAARANGLSAPHRVSRARGFSSWRCKGFEEGGGASARWHLASTDIHEVSFPRLNSVIPRGFPYAVAFHGFDEPPTDVLIGGGAPESLKQEIKTTINGALAGSRMRVRIASPDEGHGGG